MHPIINMLDPGIANVVALLRASGIDTFSSCQGGPGHEFNCPTIRIAPPDPLDMETEVRRVARVLIETGYGGFYVKTVVAFQNRAEPWQVDKVSFVEVEFWGDVRT